MESSTTIKLSEDEFYSIFKLQKNQFDYFAGFDGCLFETDGVELDYVLEMNKTDRVETVIEVMKMKKIIF